MSTILRNLILGLVVASSALAQTKVREGSQTQGALPTSQGGVPSGGTANQVLSKIDGTSYNVQWTTGGGGGGAVDSVFGRTGVVIATTGDYTAAQVTNAVSTAGSYSNPSWITALIWSKITSTPTTIAGYGITDFNSLGDARWVLKNGSITGATKTKITFDAKGLVTSGADATTADLADSSNKRYVTDAELTVLGNTSGTNTGDQDLSGLVPKTTAVNGHALSSNVTVTASDVSLGNVTNDAQTKVAVVPNTAPGSGQILVGNAGGTAYAKQTLSGSGATATLSDTGVLTLSAIPNATLSNSAITIAGTSTSLGGSIALDTISGVSSNGFLKRTGTNTWTNDANAYLTGNQTITLSGDVTGSGTTAITTANVNLPDGVTQAGSLLIMDIAAPSSPAASHLKVFGDSTDLRFHDKNAAGTIGTTVVADTGASNNFLTSISAAGVISKAQPTDANLSTSDVATNNATTSKHGFLLKLDNTATHYMDGTGTWSVPTGSGVTSIATASPISGGTITTTGTISLLTNVDFVFTLAQSITVTDATTNAVTDTLFLDHETSGTPANGLGAGFCFKLQDSTTANVAAAKIRSAWSNVTHASNTSYIDFQAKTGGAAAASVARMFGSGGFSVNNTTDPGAGIISANTGYIIGTSGSTSGKILKSDGDKFSASTETYAAPGTSGNVLTSDGTNWTSAASTNPSAGNPTTKVGTSVVNGSASTFMRSDGAPALDQTIDLAMTAAQNIKSADANGNVVDLLTLAHNYTSAGGISTGTALQFNIKDSTTADANATRLEAKWSTATHNSTASYLQIDAVTGSTQAAVAIFSGAGGLSVGRSTTTTPAAGVIDMNGAAEEGLTYSGGATTGKMLQADGTVYKPSTPTWPTSASTTGTVPRADGTNYVATDTAEWDGEACVITSDYTNSSSGSFADITGMVTPTLSNSTLYEIEVDIYASCSSTGGITWAIHGAGSGSAATGSVIGSALLATANATPVNVLLTAVDTASSTTHTLTGAPLGVLTLKGFMVTTSTGTATLSIQTHPITNTQTVTVKKGSCLKYRKAKIS